MKSVSRSYYQCTSPLPEMQNRSALFASSGLLDAVVLRGNIDRYDGESYASIKAITGHFRENVRMHLAIS